MQRCSGNWEPGFDGGARRGNGGSRATSGRSTKASDYPGDSPGQETSARDPLDALDQFPRALHHDLERPPHLLERFRQRLQASSCRLSAWDWTGHHRSLFSRVVLEGNERPLPCNARAGLPLLLCLDLCHQRLPLCAFRHLLRRVALRGTRPEEPETSNPGDVEGPAPEQLPAAADQIQRRTKNRLYLGNLDGFWESHHRPRDLQADPVALDNNFAGWLRNGAMGAFSADPRLLRILPRSRDPGGAGGLEQFPQHGEWTGSKADPGTVPGNREEE